MNYRSKKELFGLPLVHVATSEVVDGVCQRGIAKGWIAIGDISYGVIFSLGGLAFGGIAIGGGAIGLLTLGGGAIGLLASIGGLAIGGIAIGGLAIGGIAIGGGAIALYAAQGGGAAAFEFAQGGLAIAKHANDQFAKDYFENSSLFLMLKSIAGYLEGARYLKWLWLIALLPVIINDLVRRRKNRVKEKHNKKGLDGRQSPPNQP